MIDIYPAIDIYNGDAVSLTQGNVEKRENFGDPVKFAESFSKISGKLHIVDLNGAFTGNAENLETIINIRQKVKAFIQLGGGLRSEESIAKAYDAGIDSVIIGTASLNDNFIDRISKIYDNLTVSIDSYDGMVRYNGWNKGTEINYINMYNKLKGKIKRFIVTSINNDGTSSIGKISKFWDDEYVIYAGGVNSKEDIKYLESAGFSGAIIGKALYNKNIKIDDLKCLQKE
ncbi:MAG: HisA/HisF-related TIM barrel protein [Ferroplasma sp.]